MTCSEFEYQADILWNKWCDASVTTDPAKWDKACELYAIAMDELRQAYGKPPRRPHQRPH